MRESPRKERCKPKRACIVQAAADLFIEHGYDGTSTEMIAEKAGVSRQTIYNQFENKEALFVAIALDVVNETIAPLAEAVENADDVRETLLALAHRLLGRILCPKTSALYRLAVTEALRFPELGRSIFEAGPVNAENAVSAYLSRQSQLQIDNPQLAARQFLALVVHPYEFKMQLGILTAVDSPEVQVVLNAAVDMFLRAYRRSPKGNDGGGVDGV